MKKKRLNFLKNRKHLLMIFVSLFLITSICTGSFFSYKKYKKTKNESKQVLSSMQTKLNELQIYKDEQIRLEKEKKRKDELAEEGKERNELQQCEDRKSECAQKIEKQRQLIYKYEKEYNQAKNKHDSFLKEMEEKRSNCEEKYDKDDIKDKMKRMDCQMEYKIEIDTDTRNEFRKKESSLGQAKSKMDTINRECSNYQNLCL